MFQKPKNNHKQLKIKQIKKNQIIFKQKKPIKMIGFSQYGIIILKTVLFYFSIKRCNSYFK